MLPNCSLAMTRNYAYFVETRLNFTVISCILQENTISGCLYVTIQVTLCVTCAIVIFATGCAGNFYDGKVQKWDWRRVYSMQNEQSVKQKTIEIDNR